MPIQCEIISQDRIVFQGEVEMVVLPGQAGEMGILPHHAPVLTSLKFGIITVKQKSGDEHFTVAGGIAEVLSEQVTILADAAENVEEIDLDRAMIARQRAEEVLKTTLQSDVDRYMRVSSALKRSNLRIDAARKYRKDYKPGLK